MNPPPSRNTVPVTKALAPFPGSYVSAAAHMTTHARTLRRRNVKKTDTQSRTKSAMRDSYCRRVTVSGTGISDGRAGADVLPPDVERPLEVPRYEVHPSPESPELPSRLFADSSR